MIVKFCCERKEKKTNGKSGKTSGERCRLTKENIFTFRFIKSLDDAHTQTTYTKKRKPNVFFSFSNHGYWIHI